MVQFTFLLAAAAFTFLLLLFLLLFPCGTDYIRRRRRSLQGRPDHPPTEVEAVVQTPPHSPHGKEGGGSKGAAEPSARPKGWRLIFETWRKS